MTILPTPPREVSLRLAMRLWWPVGLLIGTVWLVITAAGIALLAQDGFRLPTRDLQLDSNCVTVTDAAEITAIENAGVHFGGKQLQAVHYFARNDGSEYRGSSFAWSGAFTIGMHAALDLLPTDHRVQRLNGSMLALSSTWLPWFAGWIWLPLCALLGFWLVQVYRLRVMLRHGAEARVEVVEASPQRFVNPPQLLVRYGFVAGDGQRREGWQWLGANSALARRLLQLPLPATAPDAAAIYDELMPGRNRLVASEQFGKA